jgi:HD-like signal output (HDOD) protein
MPATTNVEAGQSNVKQIDRLALEARLVRELDGGRAALPILPHVAAQAIRFANDPNSDLRKLAELVEADPPIAARLLAVANSVIYTRAVRVSSTRLAIIRLGLEGTRDLLFQVVYASSTVGLPRYQDLVAKSFRRSVLCGLAARLVSDNKHYRFEYDYLCGLLHDIGEARIYRILANYQEAIDPAVLEDLVARYHRRAGAELAIAWGLPEPIIEACAHHHDDPANATNLVKMVMMADLLVTIQDGRQRAAVAASTAAKEATAANRASATPDPLASATDPAAADGAPGPAAAADGAPGPTDPGAALGPTSAVWPTNLNDPPGAPEPKSATWATKADAVANPASSDSSPKAGAPLPIAVISPGPGGTPEPTPEDREAAAFDQLAAMGMDRELADTILAKLDDAIADLPL